MRTSRTGPVVRARSDTAGTADIVRAYLSRRFLPDVAPQDIPADYDLAATGVIDSLDAFTVLSWLVETFGLREVETVTPCQLASVDLIEAFIRDNARHHGREEAPDGEREESLDR
jgi:hypothetical protein